MESPRGSTLHGPVSGQGSKPPPSPPPLPVAPPVGATSPPSGSPPAPAPPPAPLPPVPVIPPVLGAAPPLRSEERRVGKECSRRKWSNSLLHAVVPSMFIGGSES